MAAFFRSTKTQFLTALATILLTCLIYIPGISGPFLFDDQSSITKNSFIKINQLNIENLISSGQSGHAGPLKRPIPMVTFALNYLLDNEYKASSFKITNIAIHAFNGFLIFILCRQLIRITHKGAHTRKTIFLFAMVTAALWTAHPLNLTSVLYIVQRMTSLSALFSLLCIIFYLTYREQSASKQNQRTLVLPLVISFTCWLLAMYSKENAATIPFIILAIEFTVLKNKLLPTLYNKTSNIIKAILFIAFCYLAFNLFSYAAAGYGSRDFTMLERVLTQSRILTYYISLVFIPRLDGLGLFHDDILVSTSLLDPISTLLSIIFILGLVTLAIYFRHKKPLFSLGILWFFIGHSIESTIISLEMTHEHRNYLPITGLIIASCSLISPNQYSNKRVCIGILSIFLILVFTTSIRAYQWGSFERLAYFEAKHHPQSARAQALNSNINHKVGNIKAATESIEIAMLLAPKEATYPIHYQHMLSEIGRPIPKHLQTETLRRLQSKIITPSTRGALMNISNCLTKKPCKEIKKNYMEWLETLIRNRPNNSLLYNLRGRGYNAEGNSVKALNDFQKSHHLDNNYLDPLFNIIEILIKNKQFLQAEEVLQWAVDKNKTAEIKHYKDIQRIRLIISTLKKRSIFKKKGSETKEQANQLDFSTITQD